MVHVRRLKVTLTAVALGSNSDGLRYLSSPGTEKIGGLRRSRYSIYPLQISPTPPLTHKHSVRMSPELLCFHCTLYNVHVGLQRSTKSKVKVYEPSRTVCHAFVSILTQCSEDMYGM